MKVQVKLFALARQLAGTETVVVELPEGATIRDLRGAIASECPGLRDVLRHAMFSVDAQYAEDRQIIPASAEIGCIPPVSGG